jgi:hypothetical protein
MNGFVAVHTVVKVLSEVYEELHTKCSLVNSFTHQ